MHPVGRNGRLLLTFTSRLQITKPAQKQALLLHVADLEVQEVYHTLTPQPSTLEDTIKALDDHFAPTGNEWYDRFIFRQTMQGVNEPIDSYGTRLKEAGAACEFPNLSGY